MGMLLWQGDGRVDSHVLSSTVNSMQEPTLPLHLQATWGYTSQKVGLVYMAGLVPALICEYLFVAYDCGRTDFRLASPLAGFFADRIGSEYITCICLILTLPWWIVLALRKTIALFIVSLALQSEHPVLARVLVLMNMTSRFLCIRCNSSSNSRVSNRFSQDARCWM